MKMKTRIAWFVAGGVLIAGVGVVWAAKKEMVLIPAEELKWVEMPAPPGMKEAPKGEAVQVATVSGDPMKGAYAAFVKLPAGQPHPLHTHSSDVKAVVLSGTFTVTPEGGVEKKIGPGGYFFVPANTKHSSSCAAGAPCVMFQEGPAKFDVKPVMEKTAAAKK
jgi:mannose-6-phosphate isomerase-like protein (cupin superfamily)